jgi:hypothetical protein
MRLTGTTQPRAVLALGDREAPNVTFGASSGTTAGEFFQIEYTSDEPLASAQLILADGRVLELTVGTGVLSVLLPPDTPEGWASIRVADAAGNSRTYPAVVQLHGAVVPPVPVRPPSYPSLPRRVVRPRRRLVTVRSSIVVASSSRLRAREHVTGLVALRSSTRVRRGPAPIRRARVVGRLRVVGATHLHVHQAVPSIVVMDTTVSVHRRDGPRLEEALLLLELM